MGGFFSSALWYHCSMQSTSPLSTLLSERMLYLVRGWKLEVVGPSFSTSNFQPLEYASISLFSVGIMHRSEFFSTNDNVCSPACNPVSAGEIHVSELNVAIIPHAGGRRSVQTRSNLGRSGHKRSQHLVINEPFDLYQVGPQIQPVTYWHLPVLVYSFVYVS